MKLDVGCGKDKVKGAIGIDINKDSAADVICDIEISLPFKDDTFDEVYCRQIVEHISDLIALMEEIWRVGKNGAKVRIEAPYYTSIGAFSNPQHRRYITERTFDIFLQGYKGSMHTTASFSMDTISYTYGIVPRILFFIPKVVFRRFLLNSTHGISFELRVKKER